MLGVPGSIPGRVVTNGDVVLVLRNFKLPSHYFVRHIIPTQHIFHELRIIVLQGLWLNLHFILLVLLLPHFGFLVRSAEILTTYPAPLNSRSQNNNSSSELAARRTATPQNLKKNGLVTNVD